MKAELRIDLLDGYWITADKYQYILRRTYVSKEKEREGKRIGGTLTTIDISYHRTVPEAVSKFLRWYVRNDIERYSGDLAGYADFIAEKENDVIRRLNVVWNASQARKERKNDRKRT